MRLLTDAVCVRALGSEKVLAAIGNRLFLLYLDASGNTHRTFATVPRFLDKINGIVACVVDVGFYQIVFHAGREAYSTTLNCHDHTFSECSVIAVPEEVQQFPVPHVPRRIYDRISCISLLSATQLCLMTCHGVAALLNLAANATTWKLVEKCACDDGSTVYCATVSGTQWEELVCFTGTALGLLLIWRVTGDTRGQVLKRISAHNGVIFSIACDFEIGLLTTTSDDRSVKFWKVWQAQDDGAVELKEQQYCFAHTARVFQCRIIKSACRTLVASIGEDSHLCLWSTDGDLLLKKRLDEGPTLWGMDYDPEMATIFITASNGNFHKYCIKRWMDDDQYSIDNPEVKDISPPLAAGEYLSKIRFMPVIDCLVAVTNKNSVISMQKDGSTVHTLAHSGEFKCSILAAGGSYLYLAGGCSIVLYDVSLRGVTNLIAKKTVSFAVEPLQTVKGENLPEGSIRSMHYCERSKTVVLCDDYGRCLVYDETLTSVCSMHRIPKSAERWITFFVIPVEGYLLMADRSGHMHLFDRMQVAPVFKLSNVHGKLGITSVVAEPCALDHSEFRLTTTGHDGRICELFLSTTPPKLERIISRKTPISWIDRTVLSKRGRLYLGFNDSRFLVADATNETLCQFDCGGGHRQWDFCYDELAGSFTFFFIQHKKLKRIHFVFELNMGSALCMPKNNWHTRACNVLCVVRRDTSDHLLLSGGEDNILRVNVLANGELLEEPRTFIHSHISSIKTILVKALGDRLLLISAGGRAQICMTSIETASLSPKEECEYMLLSSDAERSRLKTNRQSSYDPETKFMCASFIGDERLVFGCSDGFVRIYKLSHNDGRWSVLLETELFYGRCILHVVTVDALRGIFVTMATDGYLCFWEDAGSKEPFHRHRHHKSGVNSVDVKLVAENKILIATGGDDQSVSVSLFELSALDGKPKIGFVGGLCEQFLHTAQVNGIQLLGNDQIVSVGVDQRLYVSSFAGYSTLDVIKAISTCISDAKGLSFVAASNEIIVYGCGIEVINLSSF
ncbi:WD repeat-containing protein 6 [Anopheles cruzii]|uniref:WD repeat-containing protein 6 n=1 Tax=Anopheles cruzii TaxID=68878 RepID=UPI0022EC247F|nr:WD repeat-containing protein 6 [Anopheles cruzii]